MQAPQHTHLAADEEEQQSAKQQQEDVESLPDSVSFTPEQPMLNGSQLPSPCMLRDAVQVALRQIRMGGFSASSSNSSRCCTPPNEGRHICAPTQCSLSAAPPGSPWVPSPPGNPQSCRRRHQSHSQSFMHGCHAWSSVERSSLDQCLVSSKSTLDSLAAGGSTPTVDVTTSHACIHEEEAEEESGGYECHESRYTLTTSSEASDREEDEESSEESFEDSLFTPKSTQLFSASVLQRTAQHEPGAKQTLKNVIQSSPRAPKFLTYALLHLHDSQYMHEKHACTGERETVEQPSVCAPGSSSKPHALKCESEAAHLPEQSVSPRGGHRALRILSRNCSSSSSATAATALSNILESSPSHSGARSGMHDPSPSSSPPPPRDSYITATVHEGDVLRSPEEQTGSESSDNLQLFEEDAHTSVDKRTSHKEKESGAFALASYHSFFCESSSLFCCLFNRHIARHTGEVAEHLGSFKNSIDHSSVAPVCLTSCCLQLCTIHHLYRLPIPL